MNDEEAKEATKELIMAILNECVKYAEKDGLSLRFVVMIVAESLMKLVGG